MASGDGIGDEDARVDVSADDIGVWIGLGEVLEPNGAYLKALRDFIEPEEGGRAARGEVVIPQEESCMQHGKGFAPRRSHFGQPRSL